MSRSPGCFGLKWWDGSVDGDWFRAADGGKFTMQKVVYQDRVRLPHCAGATIAANRFPSYCLCYIEVRREEICPRTPQRARIIRPVNSELSLGAVFIPRPRF